MFSSKQLVGTLLIGIGAGMIVSIVFGGWFLQLLFGAALIVIGFLFGRCASS